MSAPESTGTTTVIVVNDGTEAMTNLRLITSERDSLPLIPSLGPGQQTNPFRVGALHTPFVQITVQGRLITAQPVEGFSGFNPPFPEGSYAVRLRLATEGNLDIRVVSTAPLSLSK